MPVQAHHPAPVGQRRVARDKHAALAGGDGLVGVEAEDAGVDSSVPTSAPPQVVGSACAASSTTFSPRRRAMSSSAGMSAAKPA